MGDSHSRRKKRKWLKEKSRIVNDMFVEAFGADRVATDEVGMRISFKLDDPVQYAQFEQFAALTADLKDEFVKTMGDAAEDIRLDHFIQLQKQTPEAKITIPHGADIDFFARIGHHMRIRKDYKPNGEIHRPILSGDDKDILPQATGREWRQVHGSKYDREILQTAIPPENASEREQQVQAVGNLVLPSKFKRVEIRDWLEHQEQVEEKHHLDQRTAIPGDWVRKPHINRFTLESDEELKRAFPPVRSR